MKHIARYLPLLLLFGFFLSLPLQLPVFGDPSSQASTETSPRYIEEAYKETGSPNLVTGVLADYRAFDTLIETIVVGIGGLACLFILGLRKEI